MKHARLIFAIGLALAVLISCDTKEKIKTGEGFLDVKGGKIWYRVAGESDKTPVLMLHGGPGYPSYYFNPLMDISKERPVITFDQLGCGRSDRITDSTLMTMDSYVEQVNQLVKFLNLKEYYLFGHSWGTMLGTDYYLKYKDGIRGLILASPCLSSTMWVSDADTLISSLPDSIEIVLRNSIKGLPQDSAKLGSAIGSYFGNFYTRKQPRSADLDSSQSQMGNNVYQYMWGPSEYFATGNLKDYDRTKDLGKINVPTLYITGEFDAARPSTVKYYQSLTPNSRLVIIKNAGHMTMHDNPSENIKAISDFLNDLDNKIN